MTYFREFSSNTCAAAGNQLFFEADPRETRVGRVFYKIAHAGTFRYSLYFTNILDSTFADGVQSRHDMPCGTWEIVKAAVARVRDSQPLTFQPLTFDGSTQKVVTPAACFHSDPLPLTFEEGESLCLELTYRGACMPYHQESLLPITALTVDGWVEDKQMPLPAMIGCDRPVKARIGFIGDSITQGIGTPPNHYTHWNALLSQRLDPAFACWNLGIGYGRAADMAANGAWFQKALQNDILFVCFGVNDLLQGASADQLIGDLTAIVERLKATGKAVVLQTIPPFDYDEATAQHWHATNKHLRRVLSQRADLLFDVAPLLGCDGAPHRARYGGHPNEEGCAVWADALYEALSHTPFGGMR